MTRARPTAAVVLGLLFALICGQALPVSAQTLEIHVAASGSLSSARAIHTAPSIEDALVIARALRREGRVPSGGIEIVLGGGLHRLEKTVAITSEDSGSPGVPFVVRGASDGSTVLSGAVPLEPESLPRGAYPGLPQAARRHVMRYRFPLAMAAIRHIDTARPQSVAILVERFTPTLTPSVPFEVFDRSGALVPARWPNTGWGAVEGPGTDGGPGQEWWTFRTDAPRLDRWRGEPDLWAAGYWKWDYSYERHRVGEVRPRTLHLTTPFVFGLKAGARARIYHALAELDAPGEWYRDHQRNVLLAWPEASASKLEISATESAFVVTGARHVRLRDLTIERFHGDTVRVSGSHDVVIERSTLRWAGLRGAAFVDSTDSGVIASEVADTGEGGVLLMGGERRTLTRAGLFVKDSRIERFARISRTFKPGIDIAGVGNIASGNFIADAPHCAIQFQGNDHVIEFNEITRVVTETSDSSAIYTAHDWTARGTLLRANFIHDIRPSSPGFDTKGIYLDDFTSGVTLSGNLFVRVDQPVFIGGGRDNIVESNVFIASEPAVHIDSRGEEWGSQYVRDPSSDLRRRLSEVPIGSPVWRNRYPSLAGLLLDEPGVAKRNVVVNNAVIGGRAFFYETYGSPERQVIGAPALTRPLSDGEIAEVSKAVTAAGVGEWISRAGLTGIVPVLPFDMMDRARRAGRPQ